MSLYLNSVSGVQQVNERKVKEVQRISVFSAKFLLMNLTFAFIFLGIYFLNVAIGLIAENKAVQLVY